ncbi:hypothetical protein NDU88_004106 [Pleurodeles waltl]|uniref:Uncharacterized protein n=1 Tax=Pleurodeles waltl TaxID=8319 RepID=A0AAV7KWR1_PLEWA|nr:hypothetical protein NDU88_004106 [Pleurodeles waltl]
MHRPAPTIWQVGLGHGMLSRVFMASGPISTAGSFLGPGELPKQQILRRPSPQLCLRGHTSSAQAQARSRVEQFPGSHR